MHVSGIWLFCTALTLCREANKMLRDVCIPAKDEQTEGMWWEAIYNMEFAGPLNAIVAPLRTMGLQLRATAKILRKHN